MNPLTNPVDTLRRFLEREKQMRQYVFKNRPADLAKKVGEADDALRALDILASQSGWRPVFEGRIADNLSTEEGAIIFEDELGEAHIPLPDGYALCVHNYREPIDQPTLFRVD